MGVVVGRLVTLSTGGTAQLVQEEEQRSEVTNEFTQLLPTAGREMRTGQIIVMFFG